MKTGVQSFHNYLESLDSGFRRNDGHQSFSTFYDFITHVILLKFSDWGVNDALRFREAVEEVEEAAYFSQG